MANANKIFILTPEGVAEHPHLTTPDTKYKPEGEYKVALKLPASDDADRLFTQLTKIADAHYKAEAAKAAKDGKRPPKRGDLPMFETADGYTLKAKLTAAGVTRATKERFTQAPRIFDADNKVWKNTVRVTGGSTLRLCCEVVPYASPTLGVSVTLRLKDVQVIELGTGSAASPFAPVQAAPSFGDGGGYTVGDDDDADF